MPNQLVPNLDISTGLAAAAAENADPRRVEAEEHYRRRHRPNWVARGGWFLLVLVGGFIATSPTWGLLPSVAGLWAAVYAALRLDQQHTHYDGFVEGYRSARDGQSRPPL